MLGIFMRRLRYIVHSHMPGPAVISFHGWRRMVHSGMKAGRVHGSLGKDSGGLLGLVVDAFAIVMGSLGIVEAHVIIEWFIIVVGTSTSFCSPGYFMVGGGTWSERYF